MVTGLALSGLVLGAVSVVSDLTGSRARDAGGAGASAVVVPGPGHDDQGPRSAPDTAPAAAPRTGEAAVLGAPPLDDPGVGHVPALAVDPRPVPQVPPRPAPERPEGTARPAIPAVLAPPAPEAGLADAQPVPVSPEPAEAPAPEARQSVSQPPAAPRTDRAAPGTVPEAAAPAIDATGHAAPAPQGPRMAIVLLDGGEGATGPALVQGFAFPLGLVIPAGRPDAAEAAARYRDAGFEVLVTADMPGNAAAFGNAIVLLPEARAGAQTPPDSKGLRAGEGRAAVVRDFDAQDLTVEAMRHLLDEGARRAAEATGGVIMYGRLRPDTIRALRLWVQEDRPPGLVLVPVSALLAGP